MAVFAVGKLPRKITGWEQNCSHPVIFKLSLLKLTAYILTADYAKIVEDVQIQGTIRPMIA